MHSFRRWDIFVLSSFFVHMGCWKSFPRLYSSPISGSGASRPVILKYINLDLHTQMMSGSAVKRRLVQVINADNMREPITRPMDRTRTVRWHETSEWQRDNKYILSGYRPEKADYKEVLTSLTFLHNETCNVYTHMIGALLLPLIAFTVIKTLSQPQFFYVSRSDYIVFGIFFCCAEACLIFSTIYHLVGSQSHEVEQIWLRMDLLGIVIVTVGTFVPGIYYVFTCEPGLQKLHWAIVS
jgi:adiponectin receptor